ncbi:MAG: AAA family ATPase [Nannocystaceae bacterium]
MVEDASRLRLEHTDAVVALHRRAAIAARRVVPDADAPYHALVRIATGGRVRDVLLGRRGVPIGRAPGAAAGDPELSMIDWQRSPLADVFLTHREGDEYELEVDRRTLSGEIVMRHLVTFAHDEPVLIESDQSTWRRGDDGWSCAPTEAPTLVPRRHRGHSIGDPVLLDPVQRGAVELPRDRALLVLGEAGFGKTTVALHRVAALARAAATAGQPLRSLVIVPSEPLRRLSQLTLARLDCESIEVATFDEWALAQARRLFPDLPQRLSRSASPVVSRFKRHPATRALLPEVVAGTPAMKQVERGDQERFGSREPLLHLFGDRELLRRAVAAAGNSFHASAVATVADHTRLQFSPTTEERYAHVDAERLATLDGRAIDEGTPTQDAGTIDIEDCAVLLELQHLGMPGLAASAGRRERYDHIVIDETQELAPIELAALGRALAEGGAITVAGDEAQQIDEGVTFAGWPAVMTELGLRGYERVELAASYRCPPEVESLARAVVGRPGEATAKPRADGAPLAWLRCAGECHVVVRVIDALLQLRERDRRARVAIICRHYESAQRLHAQLQRGFDVRLALDGDLDFLPGALVTSVEEVRGLEFDYVIVPDASPGSYPDDAPARRALYVATTRTMHQLWMMTPSLWSPLVRAHAAV